MKKITQLIIISTLALSGAAIANQQGGFSDGKQQSKQQMKGNHAQGGLVSATTVAQAKQLGDDAWVVLTGNITKQLAKDKYLFKDKTGEIEIEIDRKQWKGQAVTPKDVVEIAGEIDKERNSVKIDVKTVKVITQAK